MRISDWSSDVCSSDLVRMTTPRPIELTAIPIAWSPPTNGTISAPVIVAPMSRSEDLDQWRGKLAGRIVLVTRPDEGSEPDRAPFRRRSEEHTSELQSLMRISYAVFCLKKKTKQQRRHELRTTQKKRHSQQS